MKYHVSNWIIAVSLILALVNFSCVQNPENAEHKAASNTSEVKELTPEEQKWLDFLITRDEINLNFKEDEPRRLLSFENFSGTKEEWKQQTKEKFSELIGFQYTQAGVVKFLRSNEFDGVEIPALKMRISDDLTIHAYLLKPAGREPYKSAVMAIHGHGRVEPAIGQYDDYHHKFAWELARDGHLVLAPELRGFSKLNNMAAHDTLTILDYWEGRYQFTLATDGFLYGNTIIGTTVEDLVRWENWLAETYFVEEIDVCGISYGGDLTIYYPVFSERVDRIFCSGSMGSFTWIFRSCYNAPAHCIPHVLNWMDRSDIAGLNYPSPIMIHYGEYDTPGKDNASAANNPSGPTAYQELRSIYRAFGNEDLLSWLVTPDSHHEMDISALLKFLN